MNKEKKKNYYFLLIYLFIVLVFSTIIMMLPKIYNENQQRYTYNIEQKVFGIFDIEEEANLASSFRQLRQTTPIEIAIVDDKEDVIYQSLPGIPYNELKGVLQKNSIIYEMMGKIDGQGGKQYKVWFSIYKPTVSEIIDTIFKFQFFLMGCITFILIFLFSRMQRQLQNPLDEVKRSIEKLNKFELSSINQEAEDVINQDVARFATTLDKQIQAVSRNYTELEYALQLERERLQNVVEVSRGIIHDLKTPLHQIMIENDLTIREKNLTPDAQLVANYNTKKIENVMFKINDTIKMMDTNVSEMIETKESFDMIAMYNDIAKGFRASLRNKKLYLDADLVEELFINKNKVAIYLILHNLLSNSINYAIIQSDIRVEIFEENHKIIISVENQTTDNNIERIQNSDALFIKEIGEEQNQEYVYSTGNGIYLIKELTMLQEGTYNLFIDDEMCEIKIQLEF